jgi:hypothetical protein
LRGENVARHQFAIEPPGLDARSALHPVSHAYGSSNVVGDYSLVLPRYSTATSQLRRPLRSQHLERQLGQVNGEEDAHDGTAK